MILSATIAVGGSLRYQIKRTSRQFVSRDQVAALSQRISQQTINRHRSRSPDTRRLNERTAPALARGTAMAGAISQAGAARHG